MKHSNASKLAHFSKKLLGDTKSRQLTQVSSLNLSVYLYKLNNLTWLVYLFRPITWFVIEH